MINCLPSSKIGGERETVFQIRLRGVTEVCVDLLVLAFWVAHLISNGGMFVLSRNAVGRIRK